MTDMIEIPKANLVYRPRRVWRKYRRLRQRTTTKMAIAVLTANLAISGCPQLLQLLGETFIEFSMMVFPDITIYFRYWRPYPFFPIVGLCCNHLPTLLELAAVENPRLPLEFWRYLSYFPRCQYLRFGRPYCYFRLHCRSSSKSLFLNGFLNICGFFYLQAQQVCITKSLA